MKKHAVITGDIVASRDLPNLSRKLLYSDLKKFMFTLKKEGWITAFEMFRGDGLQCVVKNNEKALRIALIIRAWLKSYLTAAHKVRNQKYKKDGMAAVKGYMPGKQDIRLSIGIGEADYSKTSLAHSDGEAFYLSGQGLDNLKNTSSRIIIQTADANLNGTLEPVILLLDAVLTKWTNNQAETAFWKLKNYKEEDIAVKIGISQSAVNQRTKTSQWNAIGKLLAWFEKTIKDS